MALALDTGGAVMMDLSSPIAGLEPAFGLPVTATGAIAVTTGTTIAGVHNGFSFDPEGRVRVATAGPIVSGVSDFPLDATGAVVTTTVDPGPGMMHSGHRSGPLGLYATIAP